jgi:RNA polymerase sigma-70 factor (ECF subfamily)
MTVDRALRDLPARDRALLTLRYAEDLTQPQIAVRLGSPEGTVKVQLHRARGRLRSLLET